MNSNHINYNKNICLGILAHVDAGKTTLSEGLLYLCGKIRQLGRVDHKDTFLDNNSMERERGITIFSKQAVLDMPNTHITLLDTPGHVDFSADMERTLQVLDYAVLVVSGLDGIQGHTMTLWRLLERYEIPTFIFVNKMDVPIADQEKLLMSIKEKLNRDCIDFSPKVPLPEFYENIAVCDEKTMEYFLENDSLTEHHISELISRRQIFPVFFGSALKMEGIEDLIKGIDRYTVMPFYGEEFGARVFKIAHDERGSRLTYLKVTGGMLSVKMPLQHSQDPETGEPIREKTDQLRVYSGEGYEAVSTVSAGEVCTVTGLNETYPGEGLGFETDSIIPLLTPVLNYRIILPEGTDPVQMMRKFKVLQEEDPSLSILWDEEVKEIHAMLMGEVQIDVLKQLIWDRFHVAVEFGEGSVVYRETIADTVEGVGHFEPLRHYAEVHLLLEPGEPGSGLQFYTACSEDVLPRNFQRLVLTHLAEKEHIGVLTGSPITDMQITLVSGKAHLKHTEGGDFRQATYRAVRNGLKKAKSVLLEPYYKFTLEMPSDFIGHAMNDIQGMGGTIDPPVMDGDHCVLTGKAPVSRMRSYQAEVTAYTRGTGRIFCSLHGYMPCKNQEEIIEKTGYDSELDLHNPTGSVFCAHGAGFVVPWYEVSEYMHLDLQNTDVKEYDYAEEIYQQKAQRSGSYASEEELMAIFERTFGPVKRKNFNSRDGQRTVSYDEKPYRPAKKKPEKEEYLLVDGYNVIFSWDELNELAKVNLNAAQDRLKDILCNYQGIRKCTVIVVFDAYKVKGHGEEVLKYHNIHVVYTKEAETADQYIEKTVHRLGKNKNITVATSDGLEQIIVMGQGAHRISSQGLRQEIEDASQSLRESVHMIRQSSKTYLFDNVSAEVAEYLEKIRLEDGGKKDHK